MVRNDEAGDHRFTKAPTRFDQPLVGLGDRVLGEHHPGDVGVEQRLHDDADARPGEQPDPLAVGDGRVRVRRPPDLADGAGDIGRRMDVEHREVLAGEARRRAVLVDCGRSYRERMGQGGDRLGDHLDGLFLPRGDGLDQVARERHAGRDRDAVTRGVAEPDGLRPIKRGLARLR